MIRSSTRGIFLAVVILFSVALILIPSNGYAEKIDVKSIGLDKTTIISFTNDAGEDVKTFRIWLGENVNFKSFKTEKGWIGEKNAQGVIIFTSSEPIKTGESVKFGVKTDKSNPVINWKGLDQANTIIDTGIVISTKITKVDQNPEINLDKNGEIFSESTFRIIPDKPNSGSTIRVTGEAFGVSQIFDFYINTKKIGSFETDKNGFFITTMKIPNTEKDRVDFKVKNNQGEEKIVSLRLGNEQNRILEFKDIKLTIKGIEKVIHRGEILNIYGTGIPNKAITIKIINQEQETVNTRTTEIDSKGNWELPNSINIPFNAKFGKYSIIVSDGKNQMLQYVEIKTDKVIQVIPEKIMFNPGELIKLNGTGLPNSSTELILENNQGDELFSNTITSDETGFIEMEYQTIENDDKEGTWVLITTQGDNKEFTYFGYGEMPTIPVNLKFDKVNYQSTETATITIIGKPSDILKIIIIDPSGNMEGDEKEIKLQEDGRGKYELQLEGFDSGIYTAVINKGEVQTHESFSVGLQIGSGQININTTKMEYHQGDKILLMGKTNPNVLLNVKLIDPNEGIIRYLEIPTDNVGIFTEDRLRIPSEGISGTWKIKVSSGNNSDMVEFNVSSLSDEMVLTIEENVKIPGIGQTFKILVITNHKTSIIIDVLNKNQEKIDKLMCNTTTDFKCEILWTVAKDITPGTYTIIAKDSTDTVKKTFEIN